jgi:cysteine desulfurase
MTLKFPIYMDNHATTPVDPRVLGAMLPYFTETFGNAASRTHAYGWTAEAAVDDARDTIAQLIGAESGKEIVFTSGATESDNLAIKGVAEYYKAKGNHIITTTIEHKAVLDSCKRLEKEGFTVTYINVGPDGLIDPKAIEAAITDKTILVSVMLANNEVGTIQPIGEIGAITRKRGVLFHCDAVQGFGKTPFDVRTMNVDLASLTAHKIYGPKGVGALYVRRSKPRVRLVAQMDGGGHERGNRSGTLNVPGIVGFAKAVSIFKQEGVAEADRIRGLRDRLHNAINKELDSVFLNGHPEKRLPGNLNLSFSFVEGEGLMMAIKDVAVSSGSACTSASLEPSYVLKALGVTEDLAHSSIRFGLGRFNTEEEIDYVANKLVKAIKRLRDMSPLYEMALEGIDPNKVEWDVPTEGAHH